MKTILVIILALGMQMTAFGQKKTTLPVPKKVKSKTIYEKLLDTENSPLAFKWVINADTLLLSNQIFRKHIEIGLYEARLENWLAKDSVSIKKDEIYNPLSSKLKFNFFKVSTNNNILTLMETETKKVIRFKLFLDPGKTKIIKIQDLNSKEIYQPTAFEGPMIGM